MQQDSGGFRHTVSRQNPNEACELNSGPGSAFAGLGHQPKLVASLNSGEPPSNDTNLGNPHLSRKSKGAAPLIFVKGEMGEPLSNCADLQAAVFVEEGLPDPALFVDSLIRPSPGNSTSVEAIQIWETGKLLGMSFAEDDGKVVSRLKAMELHDAVA
ncbi:hypothetical protein Ancab_005240 [Ancistrocladus abbreviatus]